MTRPEYRSLLVLLLMTLLLHAGNAVAQQSQDFGEYVVHYNALNTSLIPPQVAQGYGIQRSTSRALINITVLKKVLQTPGTPVHAGVAIDAVNLTGQRREIELREISESEGAIYYIGEFPVRNMESYAFKITVSPEGGDEPLVIEFRQQFYTE
jgi:hypothetical protein